MVAMPRAVPRQAEHISEVGAQAHVNILPSSLSNPLIHCSTLAQSPNSSARDPLASANRGED
jgi:hypothetical protein